MNANLSGLSTLEDPKISRFRIPRLQDFISQGFNISYPKIAGPQGPPTCQRTLKVLNSHLHSAVKHLKFLNALKVFQHSLEVTWRQQPVAWQRLQGVQQSLSFSGQVSEVSRCNLKANPIISGKK
ncbi:unnamed protein product [Closterium sp. Yama58-4]|nr:unnamed protein product [Closterium sp. Yama58-4]